MDQLTKPFQQGQSANYHHRLAGLYFFRDLYADVHEKGVVLAGDPRGDPAASDQEIHKYFQDMITKSLADEVPNVKVQACQIVALLAELLQDDPAVKEEVGNCMTDEDEDVQEFGRRANIALKHGVSYIKMNDF